MVMSVVESLAAEGHDPGLRGARVLLSGLECGHGVDIARAFAAAECRLVLQTPCMSPALDVLLEDLACTAQEVTISSAPVDSDEAALRFAQNAVGAYGGLDAVINLARLDDEGLSGDCSPAEIEQRVHDTLGPAFRITHVVANRMQLTWTEGLILNIVTQGRANSAAADAFASIARTALAGLTRREAAHWAGQGVRINAIAPVDTSLSWAMSGPVGLSSEPEIAALALHLASNRGRALSGLVFDAAGAACIESCPLG